MPIDASIPMGFRAAPQDVMGAYEQGQRISNNDVVNESNMRTNELQKVGYRDQLIARAARFGAKSPSDWDRAFTAIAKDVPDAARYIGQWSPQAADELTSTMQGAGPQQRAGGIGGGGGGGGDGGGIDAAMVDRSKPGAPTGAGVDMGIMSPEKASDGYNKLTTGARLLSRPGAITSGAEYRQALVSMEGSFPQIHQLVAQRDEAKVFDDPTGWSRDMADLVSGWRAYAEKLRPLATAVQSGLPVQEPQPGYKSDVFQTGIVQTTTPPGGGRPTYDFTATPESFTRNSAGRGGGGGGGPSGLNAIEDQYNALSPENQKVIDHEAEVYNVDRTLPKSGAGKDAAALKNMILWRAGGLSVAAGRSGEEDLVRKGSYAGYIAAARKQAVTGANLAQASNALVGSTKLLLDSFKQVENYDFLPLNSILNTADEQLGGTRMVDLKNKLRTTISDYTMLLVRNGVRTDAADHEASQLLTTSHTWDQAAIAVRAMEAEAENLKTATNTTTFDIMNNFRRAVGQKQLRDVDSSVTTTPATTPKTTGKPKPGWAP